VQTSIAVQQSSTAEINIRASLNHQTHGSDHLSILVPMYEVTDCYGWSNCPR